MEITTLPLFTRNALSTTFDENGGPPDVLVLCGSGTSWDDSHLIVEDDFGSADFVELVSLKLVIPQPPKVLVAVGAFSNRFGESAIEEAVAPIVLLLDDTGLGATEGYEAVAQIFRELLKTEVLTEASQISKIFAEVKMKFWNGIQKADFLRLYTAHRAIAPVIPMRVLPGKCGVQDNHEIAALRAIQCFRVFRQISFEGRSPMMSQIINAIERNCTHTIVLLNGESGCGRTELAAQIMLWFLDRAKLTCGIWGNCDAQSDVVHQVRHEPGDVTAIGADAMQKLARTC